MNLIDLIERPEWMQSAACRGMDVTIFYPPVGKPGTTAGYMAHYSVDDARSDLEGAA